VVKSNVIAPKISEWGDVAILAIAVCLFEMLALRLPGAFPDDAFISFRYAEHLADGWGLAFNPGSSPVEGYSNFLWVLILAGCRALGFDVPTAATTLSLAFGLAVVALAWGLFRKRGYSGFRLLVPMVLAATCGPLVLYSASGMETSLHALLLLGIVAAVSRIAASPNVWAFVLFSVLATLLALNRPEGVLAPPLLIFFLYWQRPADSHRRRYRYGLGSSLVLFLLFWGAYSIWRVAYFGSFWPTPFLSKGGFTTSLLEAIRTNIQFFFSRHNNHFAPLGYYFGLLFLLASMNFLTRETRKPEQAADWIGLILFLIYGAAYLAFVDWMPGMRYHAPLLVLLFLPTAGLSGKIIDSFRHYGEKRRAWASWVVVLTVCLMGLWTTAQLELDVASLTSTKQTYAAVGQWLDRELPANAWIVVSDVGIIPYYARRPTLDSNPRSLTDAHMARHGLDTDYIYSHNPAALLFISFSSAEPRFYSQHEAIVSDPRFSADYRRVGVARMEWYLDRSIWVYLRNDIPSPPGAVEQFPKGLF